MKVALIHDFLREYGGAERVLESLHQLYPNAPVYVAFLDKKALGTHWNRFADWDIRETWFGRIPFYKKIYSPIRFLAPHAFASLDLSAYDLVISSSNAFMAKG
ncbi:MAG: glycosyltransferase family 4 protein, partial [Patescibacteria group bacterium]|nr:glycosyltransferase family 4 protein [Patescibacteria group bacterium]